MTASKNENEPGEPAGLKDDEIKTERSLGRRSLLTLVAGAVGAGVASCVPVGPGGFTTTNPGYTGLTDNDTGQFQDQPNYGRFGGGGGPTYTGLTDNDSGAYQDQEGYGRFGGGGGGAIYTGFNDNDTGAYADAAGYGRGTGSSYTGLNDSDTGPYADAAGYGRRGW